MLKRVAPLGIVTTVLQVVKYRLKCDPDL